MLKIARLTALLLSLLLPAAAAGQTIIDTEDKTTVHRQFQLTYPLALAAGRGLVNDHTYVYKFGFSDVVGTTEATLWDGISTQALVDYPGSAIQVKVSSSSANDAAAGTGLRTLTVYGLDANWEPQSEVVTLNGQTEVLTTGTYIRVFRAVGETAGSGGVNAGTIWFGTGTVTTGVPATRFMAMAAGENQTLHAAWCVGQDREALLRMVWASSFGNTSAVATVRLVAQPEGSIWQVKDKFLVTRGSVPVEHGIYVGFPAKTCFEIRVTASSGTIDVSGAFEAFVVEQ